jgi:hypothetical protein
MVSMTVGVVLAVVIITAIVALLRRSPVHTVGEVAGHSFNCSSELRAFLAAYTTAPDKSHPSYIRALTDLKRRATDVMQEVETLDRSLPQNDYAHRQALVFDVAEAVDPDGIAFLRLVAVHPLPQGATHDLSGPVILETGLSLTAIDGLEWLAAAGHADAAAALVEAVRVPSLTVRACALTALRESGRTQTEYETAVSALPRELSYLGDVRRTRIQDVPQVTDPRNHLRRPERLTHKRPPIDTARAGFVSPAYRERRGPAPRAGGGHTHG